MAGCGTTSVSEKSRTARGGRAVDPETCAAIGALPLPVDWALVRLYPPDCAGRASVLRRVVLWLSRGRAVALGNHVFLPARCAGDLAVVAHEVMHCAQYQRWGAWRYFGRGASEQMRDLSHRLGFGRSPYRYDVSPERPFESYGMEEQAQIVEDAHRGRPGARAITEACRARAL